jgi:hypothetical protein
MSRLNRFWDRSWQLLFQICSGRRQRYSESSSNPGVTQLELGTADTTSETRLPVRRSGSWSGSVAAGVRHAASSASVVSLQTVDSPLG